MTRGVLALLVGLLGPGLLRAQAPAPPALAALADSARAAWLAHEPARLVPALSRVRLTMPAGEPSEALVAAQAVALLAEFVAGDEELECRVLGARQMGGDRGFVQLERHFRVRGTQGTRVQTVLLGYRLGSTGWVLTELRVLE